MADREVALLGPSEVTSKPVQVMQLDMSNDMLEELLECVRSGKPPQILFGNSPSIRYDGKSRGLSAQPEKFRHELYRTGGDNNNEWEFAGVIDHTMAIAGADTAAVGMDLALETLRNRVAAEKMERETNKTLIRTPDLSATKKKLPAGRNSQLSATLKPNSLKSTTLGHPGSPLQISPNKSSQTDENMFENGTHPSRHPLVHSLAAEPKTFDEAGLQIYGPSWKRSNLFPIYKKLWALVAQPVKADDPEGSHTLINKIFKEVKPYEFRGFTDNVELREKAVENAVRAFDRMRIAKTDLLWQQLLPKEERGKGICLSRLNLLAPQIRTPVATPNKFAKKTAPTKKADAAKPGKKTSDSDLEKISPEKPRKSAEEREKPRAIVKDSLKVTSKDSPRVNPKGAGTPLARPVQPAERHGGTKSAAPRAEERSAGRNSTKPDAASSPLQRANKTSTNAKSLLNKPKNPSPLSRSPPVNASDFRHDHPVHKKLAAAVSPSRTLKRKADSDAELPSKRQNTSSSTSSTASSAEKMKARSAVTGATDRSRDHINGASKIDSSTPSSLKRKATPADLDSSDSSNKLSNADHYSHPPNKSRKTIPSSSARSTNHNHHHSRADKTPPLSTSSDLDSDNGPIRLTWKQAVDAALRFERYYPKYKRRWEELCSRDRDSPPSREEREQFMVMHRKIEEMKRQIREAVEKGRDGGREFD